MFIKRLFAFFISLSLAYAPIANAQSTAAYELFMAKVTTWGSTTVKFASTGAPLVSSAAPLFEASTFSGGGSAISTAAKMAVGSGEAAVVVKGAATASNIFAGVRAVVVGGSGFGLIAMTAFTLAPMVVDYFLSDKTRLGPLSERDSDKPFEARFRKDQIMWISPHNVKWFPDALSACRNSYPAVPGLTAVMLSPTSAHCKTGTGYLAQVSGSLQPGLGDWLPASWDDISPYMDVPEKIVTGDQFKALLDAGAKIEAQPKTITGPAEVLHPSTKTTTETPEKLTTTTTTPKTKLEYTTKLDPVTGQTVPIVKATPSSETTVVEKDKATGVEKLISTTRTESPKTETPKAAETPDLCALHPDIVACVLPAEIDVCKLHPDSLGCLEKDEPDDPDLKKEDREVSITPQSGWSIGGGSCPAPRNLSSVSGAAFSFQPICDFMTGIRPVLIGVSWITAAYILMGARKDSE